MSALAATFPGSATHAAGLRVNEVSFAGSPQWVEIHNDEASPVSATGHFVSDEDGNDYPIPAALPPVPGGGFVVLVYDGTGPGADDYDFSDNVATLHSLPSQVLPFEAAGDQVSLYSAAAYSPAALVSFVAWGEQPGVDAANAVAAGQWPGPATIIGVDAGAEPLEGPMYRSTPDGSIGVVPGCSPVNIDCWVAYEALAASPGAPNPPPGPALYLPPDGIQSEDLAGSFTWVDIPGASRYEFQLAGDLAFTNVVIEDLNLPEPVETIAGAVPAGVYYWHVRAVDGANVPGPYSGARSITVGYPEEPALDAPGGKHGRRGGNDAPAAAFGAGPNFSVSGKTTDSVSGNALSGVNISLGGALTATSAANGTWTVNNVPPGNYVVTASIANYTNATANIAVVNANVNNVNQALVGKNKTIGVASLAARKDGPLICMDGDCEQTGANNYAWDGSHTALANWKKHESMYCTPTAGKMLAQYKGGTITIEEVSYELWKDDTPGPERDLGHGLGHTKDQGVKAITFALQCTAAQANVLNVQPTDAQLVAFIDDNRPLRYSTGEHAMVVDGYRWVNKRLQAHYLNTDNNGRTEWHYWLGAGAEDFSWCAAPVAGLTGRNTDPKVALDADGDGISDFDEEKRFLTDKTKVDTDNDKVPDKIEVVSYRYPSPVRAVGPDVDGDDLRTERDPDSDNGGCKDGQEDINRDGKRDVGESDVFKAIDEHHVADLNQDCKIDVNDFMIFLGSFGFSVGDAEYLPEADYNNDFTVDLEDYQIWYGYYTQFNS